MSVGTTETNAIGQSLCDDCNKIRVPLEQKFQRHICGYEQLVSRATRCALCFLVRKGLRREFVATSTTSMINCDMDLVDKAISASIIYGNPYVPAIPGWVAIRGQRGHEDRIDVFVSPRAHCVLVVSPGLETKALRLQQPCYFPYGGGTLANDGCSLNNESGTRELYYARKLVWEDVRLRGEMEKSLPSRILDVGTDPLRDSFKASVANQVRLVEPKTQSRGVYMTLSHRWGPSTRLKTTSNTIANYRKGIDWQDIPRTFQHAIEVCRSLDVRYLWIDSLCIIQDDEADWAHESKLMGDIYHNALCTIASHCSDNDNDGFLSKAFEKVSVTVCGKNDSTFRISLPAFFSRAIAHDSSISWRGWVLQERLLSTRILHFLPHQLYFETVGNNVISLDTGKQQYVDTTPPVLSTWLLKKPWITHSPEDIQSKWPLAVTSYATEWQQVVEWYSRCALTKENDKLPALAGMAAMMQRASHDNYLAGLWGTSFQRDLLWVAADGTQTRRPTSARASSWSWASLDGAIIYLTPAYYREGSASMMIGYSGSADSDREQLFHVTGQLGHQYPIWIDKPAPLHLVALPTKLPRLGNRSNPSCVRLQGCKAIRDILLLKRNMSDTLFRPVEMADQIVGLVFLDIETEDGGEKHPLFYLKIGSTNNSYYVLVVYQNPQGGNVYKRVGLGILSRIILDKDGTSCMLSQVLDGLEKTEKWGTVVVI